MKKQYYVLLIVLVLICCLFIPACSNKNSGDIIIVYTTDVHCGVSDNIGYSRLSAYVNDLKQVNKNVSLVDAGDAIQGDLVGSLSKGKYIIDIMNQANYDLYVLGNHEFDYGIDALSQRIDEFNGSVLSCNFKYTGNGENKLAKLKSYSVIDYGVAKVGYVGVTTPHTLISSNPQNFKENGEVAYSFSQDSFTQTVQSNIDACKKAGCKYVVIVSHLGYADSYTPYSANELIKNTNGVDVVIDGHSHESVSCNYYENKDGAMVPLCTAGYKMNVFGRVTITKSGAIQVGHISSYPKEDEQIKAKIVEIDEQLAVDINKVVATSDISLPTTDAAGVRMVRNREMGIANLVADSTRYVSGADIGIINGGGVRAGIDEGNITYGDIKKVLPFENQLCIIKATGQQIVDYLEFTARKTETQYKVDGKAVGENGSFAQVSGLKYTIDTSIPSSVEVDDVGAFKAINGERRVKDVYVLQNNTYVPIELDRVYTVSSITYILFDGGDGVTMFNGCEVVSSNVMLDSEALTIYIVDVLHGGLRSQYETVGNRINII